MITSLPLPLRLYFIRHGETEWSDPASEVAVISGGDWPQFETQLLANLSPDANLKNLSLLPTCGTKFYQFDSDWQHGEGPKTGGQE